MTRSEAEQTVAAELLRVAEREVFWLQLSDSKLFAGGAAAQWMRPLVAAPDLAETIDAFCARFGRLQDTLGDRLLPRALAAQQELLAGFLDNLHRAERLGWVASAPEFAAARRLRNRMVHDYSLEPQVLAEILDEAHRLVPMLVDTCVRLRQVLQPAP